MATIEQLNKANSFSINKQNYDRNLTQVTINIGDNLTLNNAEQYILGVNYTESNDIQTGYLLGSARPGYYGYGNITSEGTITFFDGGLARMQKLAEDNEVPSMIWLGRNGQVDIEIKYFDYAGNEKIDKLLGVFFTEYSNGVNVDDVLYQREIPITIGKVIQGSSTF